MGKYDLFPTINKPSVIRNRIMWLVAFSAMFWALLGFDSTWEQLTPITNRILTDPGGLIASVLSRGPDYQKMLTEMASVYGIGDHWSAPVIYGLCFIALSAYLERRGVVKSLNFFLTFGLWLGNIGFFELVWNRLYSLLQNQSWTFAFVVPQQIRNLGFFIVFVFLGALSFLIIYGLGYRVTFPWWKQVLVAASVFLWALWIWYPFPVMQIVVATSSGPWFSSHLFPQTFYAVQITPGVTVPYYAPNDWLHLLNTVCKALSAAAVTSLCMVVKKDA